MTGPLSGVRIIDLSAQYSGPIATGLLADQGADVIKIETIGGGDGVRHTQPARGGLSAMFAHINRNKRSVALDIRKPEGKAALHDLLKDADVLVQNFRPGVIDRLGFGYEAVAASNPGIVHVSVNGFGGDGPYAGRRAYDMVVQAEAGYPSIQADPDTGEPQMVRQGVVDKLTAVMVAQATATALYARSQHPQGRGQAIEVPMLDAALWFIWPDCMYNHILMDPSIPKVPEVHEHARLRKTKDGNLMVQLVGQQEYEGMCRALGRPEMIEDPRFSTAVERNKHLRELNTVFAADFATFATDEIYRRLMEEDVPVSRIRSLEDVLADPQVQARGVVKVVKDVTGAEMRQVKHPINFSASLTGEHRHAPFLGQHTLEVLRELGYKEAQIEAMLEAGAAAAS
jgi:crotonobetainyl-CoA:carnitine CoA-transferase CaiB-like acyl-CoA transferase